MKRGVLFVVIGAAIGALGGWLYWSQVGCSNGSCMITSHPLSSTLYGTIIGGLVGSSFQDLTGRKNTNKEHN